MKILGIIGGTSWASTIDYYQAINLGVNEKLAGNNFAECIIYSLNFHDVIETVSKGKLEGTYKLLFEAGTKLKNSGAKAIVLAANTMHIFAERLQDALQLPVIHIATATAAEVRRDGFKKVGLLGKQTHYGKGFFQRQTYRTGY